MQGHSLRRACSQSVRRGWSQLLLQEMNDEYAKRPMLKPLHSRQEGRADSDQQVTSFRLLHKRRQCSWQRVAPSRVSADFRGSRVDVPAIRLSLSTPLSPPE